MRDAVTGEPITADEDYRFHTEYGFCRVDRDNGDSDNEYSVINADSALGSYEPPLIAGSAILAIRNDDYHDKKVRQYAKKIMRLALAPHLGGRPLKSRELYRRPE